MALIDTHAHLDMLAAPISEVLKRAAEVGVTDIVTVGASLASSAAGIALAEEHDGLAGPPAVWATVGIHPHEARHYDAQVGRLLREMAAHPRVVAVGETGLDLHYAHSPLGMQAHAFREHARIACEARLPLIVHDREAHEEVFDALTRYIGPASVPTCRPTGVLIHCFSGDEEWARRFSDLGCYIAVGGALTFKKADALRRAVRAVPEDRLLLETDCPYLSPEPYRGRENEPARVAIVADAVARAKGLDTACVERMTCENARDLLSLAGRGRQTAELACD